MAHLDALEAVQQLDRGVYAAQLAEAGVHQVTGGQLNVIGVPRKARPHSSPFRGVGLVEGVEGDVGHWLHHGLRTRLNALY